MSVHAWLLRPLPHGSNHMRDFLENDRIAVGYPVGERLDQYTRSELRKILIKFGWEGGYGNVDRLVNRMRQGDLVVVPDDNARDVYFARITSDYIYVPELDQDVAGSGYPHQRKVEWFFDKQPVARQQLPERLLESLRYPGAVAELTKHLSLILQLVGIGGDDHPPVPVIENEWAEVMEKATAVLMDAMDSDDPNVALKAVEIALQYGKRD